MTKGWNFFHLLLVSVFLVFKLKKTQKSISCILEIFARRSSYSLHQMIVPVLIKQQCSASHVFRVAEILVHSASSVLDWKLTAIVARDLARKQPESSCEVGSKYRWAEAVGSRGPCAGLQSGGRQEMEAGCRLVGAHCMCALMVYCCLPLEPFITGAAFPAVPAALCSSLDSSLRSCSVKKCIRASRQPV